MILAFDGSRIDGPAYTGVVSLAHRSPGWLDETVVTWSTYGLALVALLMAVGWWRARHRSATAALTGLTAPVIVAVAYGANSVLKFAVREDRPCHSLHVSTLEACPAPGDWSFPSNHAAIAAAAAVILFFVSRRLGAVAVVAACAMTASRVWVGAHYPHDVLAGAVVGGLVALCAGLFLRREVPGALAGHLAATRLRPLLLAS
ncbi:phosphatase PAP2 family protein [Streptomyces niger]|uniref:phosphatase PAP2 family protein n=1 Tax=Streptomyces niger TaxID=66373 RepID=UPI00069A6E3F|nr:phosphatase PAP2 family protein [Streptomyces niger]